MNCKVGKYLDIQPKNGTQRVTPDKRIVGKAALITGASSGLGRQLAILFSHSGHVILSGRNRNGLEETRKQCYDPANTTISFGDLRDGANVTQLVSFADLYSIRYLVCSAGEYRRGKILDDPFRESLLDMFQSNATATINLISRVYPVLCRTAGSIIHINSIAGKGLSPDEAHYSASKFAVKGFLQSFRFEAREKGVRVLDVFPGAIQTPMCTDRPGYDKMMDSKEVAEAIYAAVNMNNTCLQTAQIEELHLGRFRV